MPPRNVRAATTKRRKSVNLVAPYRGALTMLLAVSSSAVGRRWSANGPGSIGPTAANSGMLTEPHAGPESRS